MSTRSPSLSAQLASAVVTGGLLVACKSPSPPAPVVFDAGLGAATVDSVVSLVKGTADLGPVGNVEAGFGGKWIATGLGIVGSSGGPLHLVSDGIDGPVRVSGGEGMFICPSEQAMVVPVAGENPFADGADGCIRIAHGGDRVLQAVGKPSSGRFFCLEAGGATVDQTSYVRTQKDCRVARLRLAELPANTATTPPSRPSSTCFAYRGSGWERRARPAARWCRRRGWSPGGAPSTAASGTAGWLRITISGSPCRTRRRWRSATRRPRTSCG